jgi:hypothetical protein
MALSYVNEIGAVADSLDPATRQAMRMARGKGYMHLDLGLAELCQVIDQRHRHVVGTGRRLLEVMAAWSDELDRGVPSIARP